MQEWITSLRLASVSSLIAAVFVKIAFELTIWHASTFFLSRPLQMAAALVKYKILSLRRLAWCAVSPLTATSFSNKAATMDWKIYLVHCLHHGMIHLISFHGDKISHGSARGSFPQVDTYVLATLITGSVSKQTPF